MLCLQFWTFEIMQKLQKGKHSFFFHISGYSASTTTDHDPRRSLLQESNLRAQNAVSTHVAPKERHEVNSNSQKNHLQPVSKSKTSPDLFPPVQKVSEQNVYGTVTTRAAWELVQKFKLEKSLFFFCVLKEEQKKKNLNCVLCWLHRTMSCLQERRITEKQFNAKLWIGKKIL